MKIVINECFGGYSISPKAALLLYARGMDVGTPVDKYFTRTKDSARHLHEWREFLKSPRDAGFLTVFSPDEKFVLNTRPDNRTDPLLIQVVEELGKEANGACAELKVITIPDGINYEINDYDGRESVHEKHESWY